MVFALQDEIFGSFDFGPNIGEAFESKVPKLRIVAIDFEGRNAAVLQKPNIGTRSAHARSVLGQKVLVVVELPLDEHVHLAASVQKTILSRVGEILDLSDGLIEVLPKVSLRFGDKDRRGGKYVCLVCNTATSGCEFRSQLLLVGIPVRHRTIWLAATQDPLSL